MAEQLILSALRCTPPELTNLLLLLNCLWLTDLQHLIKIIFCSILLNVALSFRIHLGTTQLVSLSHHLIYVHNNSQNATGGKLHSSLT